MDDYTRKFDFSKEQDVEIHRILLAVYQALEEKGYNPINQIVGYILSEDPTYITNHNQARTLIRKIDRDELLQILVRKYLGQYRHAAAFVAALPFLSVAPLEETPLASLAGRIPQPPAGRLFFYPSC